MSVKNNKMETGPLVSILSPCYNVGQYLPQCLDSIIGQTYRNLQIVCIDDGSKDNTWNVLQEYVTRDSRVEIYHQENAGVAAARNNLLSHVKGDYVLFVDSDDWIEPDMVEFLVEKSRAKDADIVVCDMVKNDAACNDGYQEELMDQETTIKKFLFHKELSGSLWNKLVKTSLLHNIRFDNRISYGEDALFCWHVLQRVHVVVQATKQLYHYRMNEVSISHQDWTPQKKGSGSIVWKTIADEAKQWWPQYADIGFARYAVEDMWGLYYASLANYPYDEHIKERQVNIRKNLKLIRKSGLVSKNKIVTAYALAYCYTLGKLLRYV